MTAPLTMMLAAHGDMRGVSAVTIGIDIERGRERLHHLLQRADDKALAEFLEETPPADLAEMMAALSETRRRQIFQALDTEAGARVLETMTYEAQYETIRTLPRPLAAGILGRMSPDDLADLLGALGHPRAEEVLALIPKEAAGIRQLMQYPEDSAGGIMTLGVVAVPSHLTAERAVAHVRKAASQAETVYYIYVKDDGGRLVGVLSLRDLVLAPPDARVADLAITNVISVHVDAHQIEVARLFERYDLLALPVVDDGGHLLGIVTVDDVIDVIQEETTRDFARLGGQQPLEEPYLGARVLSLVRKRICWLLLLFVAQSLTGNILAAYESSLQAVIALSFFVPLLIGTAGNAGSQAATLLVRAMGIGEVSWQDFGRVVGREMLVAATLGSVLAAVAFVWATLFTRDAGVGLTVGLAVLAVILVASTIGAALPMVVTRFGLDPAVASAPLVTTITDASGLLIYFSVASWVLGV